MLTQLGLPNLSDAAFMGACSCRCSCCHDPPGPAAPVDQGALHLLVAVVVPDRRFSQKPQVYITVRQSDFAPSTAQPRMSDGLSFWLYFKGHHRRSTSWMFNGRSTFQPLLRFQLTTLQNPKSLDCAA